MAVVLVVEEEEEEEKCYAKNKCVMLHTLIRPDMKTVPQRWKQI